MKIPLHIQKWLKEYSFKDLKVEVISMEPSFAIPIGYIYDLEDVMIITSDRSLLIDFLEDIRDNQVKSGFTLEQRINMVNEVIKKIFTTPCFKYKEDMYIMF